MTSATPARAALIALDWGTSSLRAYRLDGAGRTLDARLPWGIMRLPQPLQDGAATPASASNWPSNRLAATGCEPSPRCRDRLRHGRQRQGWQEAAYLDVPVALDRIGTLLTVVERPGATPVHIVPGLIQRHGLPNVMRGEETQVFGVLRDARAVPDAGLLIGLPGTHSSGSARATARSRLRHLHDRRGLRRAARPHHPGPHHERCRRATWPPS